MKQKQASKEVKTEFLKLMTTKLTSRNTLKQLRTIHRFYRQNVDMSLPKAEHICCGGLTRWMNFYNDIFDQWTLDLVDLTEMING